MEITASQLRKTVIMSILLGIICLGIGMMLGRNRNAHPANNRVMEVERESGVPTFRGSSELVQCPECYSRNIRFKMNRERWLWREEYFDLSERYE